MLIKSHKLKPYIFEFRIYEHFFKFRIPTKNTGDKLTSDNKVTYYIDKNYPMYVKDFEITHISIVNKNAIYTIGLIYKDIYFELKNTGSQYGIFRISKFKPNNKKCNELDDQIYMQLITEILSFFKIEYEFEDLTIYVAQSGKLQIRPLLDKIATKKHLETKIRIKKSVGRKFLHALSDVFTFS